MSKTVRELAGLVGGAVSGDGSTSIEGITNLETPAKGLITFAQDEKSFKLLDSSPIACLIVPMNIQVSSKPLIRVENPKLAWAKLMEVFFPAPQYSQTLAKEASIADSAKIGRRVTVEPFARIAENAELGDESVIRSYAFVGENVKVGAQSILHPGVVIYRNCVLGKSVIIHAGTIIGADGFGYVGTQAGQIKVPQVGNVVIEDEVEIGASSTIDRATVGSTHIGKGCKFDNLVQIGHNVVIGEHTVISAQTGISGSTKIGSHVTMGGKVGIGDHVEVGDWVMIGAGAGLPTGKKIPPRQIIFGQPARPYQEARRQIAAQLRSAEMYEEIKTLKKKVAQLEMKLSEEKI